MKQNKIALIVSTLVCVLASICICLGQSRPEAPGKQLKNTVRFNLTGLILFSGGYTVIGYERVVKPNQSFSVNFGVAKLPNFSSITTDSFRLIRDTKNTGFNVSVDYRFYLKKENKYLAPRGVYVGPYYSMNLFHRENAWDFRNGQAQVSTDTKFTVHTAGVELGYQFVIRKRLAIDLVMIGPGVGFYDFTSVINSNANLDQDSKDQLHDAVQQVVSQKFPGLNLVLKDKEVDGNGAFRITSVGFRYLIQIGFRF